MFTGISPYSRFLLYSLWLPDQTLNFGDPKIRRSENLRLPKESFINLRGWQSNGYQAIYRKGRKIAIQYLVSSPVRPLHTEIGPTKFQNNQIPCRMTEFTYRHRGMGMIRFENMAIFSIVRSLILPSI